MRTISFQHLHLPEFGCYSHLHFYLQFGSDSIGCERRIFDGTPNGSFLRQDSHVDSCMDRESTHTHTHWLLKRCLPGQRNAALRWQQHIGGLCEHADLEAFLGAPTILRHRDLKRKVFVNTHVDDILLGNPGDVEWFQSTVGATLTMKVDGLHEPGSGSQLMYLKKRMTMKPGGILLQPNSTYIPQLLVLMRVSGRRKKGLPIWWSRTSCLTQNKLQLFDHGLVWLCLWRWVVQTFSSQ